MEEKVEEETSKYQPTLEENIYIALPSAAHTQWFSTEMTLTPLVCETAFDSSFASLMIWPV